MPPTSNNQYLPIIVKGHVRFVPSTGLKVFKSKMKMYQHTHSAITEKAALDIARHVISGGKLHIDRFFYFPHERLYSKSGSVKKLDVSNRVKALDDCLADMLGFDDRHFFSGSMHKIAHRGDEKARIVIEFYKDNLNFGDTTNA